MSERDDETWNDDGENDTTGTECDHPVDPEAAVRAYRVARADFALGRTEWLWPCVAVAVDAAFVLGDPVGALPLCKDTEVAGRYDRVAARVWNALCSALLDSTGQVDGLLVISYDEVYEILVDRVLSEYVDPEGRFGDGRSTEVDEQFASIIGDAFGVEVGRFVPPGTSDAVGSAAASPADSTEDVIVNMERLEEMAGWLHRRLHALPFRWTGGEE
jgi:hypothetical protein